MAKENQPDKPASLISGILGFFHQLIEIIKAESEERIEHIRARLKYYVLIYGLLMTAILFILIGVVKYLAETSVFASEGISFLAVGSIIIVLLSAYTLIKRI